MRGKSFKFDQVFTNESSQSDLYNGLGISNLVTKVIEVIIYNNLKYSIRVITVLYLLMGRQAVGRPSQWKGMILCQISEIPQIRLKQ